LTVRKLSLVFLVFAAATFAHAGGPAYVAGASYFDPAVKGTPLTWANGAVTYYTDQGNLSALLPGPSADAFVASAFAAWTSIPTAAVSALHAGQLAEDVSGANVALSANALGMPFDILPSAIATPVAIVYDADGSVTDALLGAGASHSSFCANNGVFGGIDNFSAGGGLLHAFIVVNGNCATSSTQLPDLQYHLVRTIGRILGLDWSQANVNVITRMPTPSANDYAGFSVMHETDPTGCVPVAACYSNNGLINPAQPKMDDRAALSRLYPVTAQNIASFPGKQILRQQTARIHGNVLFSDATGLPAQPMQGVNVVARWIDPATRLPSGTFVASSVSGFLFASNAGNLVSGFTDSTTQNLNRFGSDDTTLEGFFDLAGLQIPSGSSAQYQLSIEPINPLWSENVGPYGSTSQVAPSGSFTPIAVTVTLGADVQQDIIMQSSAVQIQRWYGPTSFASPAAFPASGNWTGALSSYAASDFFQFDAQANRTLSVMVNALDEAGNLSQDKLLPVIGIWAIANPGQSPAPANTSSAFNTSYFAETRLDAQILQSTTFRLGIADFRGDGRPDFRYNARVLYGDKLLPSRAGVAGGSPVTIQGLGLQRDTQVQSAGLSVPVLASSAKQLLVNTPPLPDGVYDFLLSDVNTGGSSNMLGVLTVGAGPGDILKLLSGSNPATPVGGQAPSPFTVKVVQSDGATPVAGASVQFTASPALAFSACGGGSNCTVFTDQSGFASTKITVLSAGATTALARLAPATYPNPQQVTATLFGTSSQADLQLLTPKVWIPQGASNSVPLTARLLSNGNPVSGSVLNYQITQGSATLSAGSAQTDSNGFAAVKLQVISVSSGVQVSVCAAPSNSPCQVFNAIVVPVSSLQIQAVTGTLQVVPPSQQLQPVVVRVTDSSTPPDPVLGASVLFQSYVGRTGQNAPIIWAGEAGISESSMSVILAAPRATVQSDVNGLAVFQLTSAGISGDVAVVGSAGVGNTTVQFAAQQLGP
jgi:hypothetical protein